MLRSMYSGLSGLQASKSVMDVIGNNISNVNTTAYKRARATFKDILYQTFGSATAPGDTTGGTNPSQVGLGTNIGSIDQILTQGTVQPTNRNTDFAIEGEGYFIASDGQQNYYTRAGNFDVDADGNLVMASNGYKIMGREAIDGEIVTSGGITGIQIPLGQITGGNATSSVELTGNLSRDAAVGDADGATSMQTTIYDEAGSPYTMTLTITKSSDNYWKVTSDVTEGSITGTSGQALGIYFDADTGELSSVSGTSLTYVTPSGSSQLMTLDFSLLAQGPEENTAFVKEQDGYTVGSLRSFSAGTDGTILGVYSNGTTRVMAQMVLANFSNPAGLLHEGNNLYSSSANSGVPAISAPGSGSLGTLRQAALERSNVDIAEEFIDMIVTQRGFQANSRVISTSDEMLQELINLKR